MTLGERRELFTISIAELIIGMRHAGYQPRLDEAKRARVTAIVYGMSPSECARAAQLLAPEFFLLSRAIQDCAKIQGSAVSVHIDGLAGDIQLWKNGVLMGAEAFEPFGLHWEQLGPLHAWGGRFSDAGHFSITPDGIRR